MSSWIFSRYSLTVRFNCGVSRVTPFPGILLLYYTTSFTAIATNSIMDSEEVIRSGAIEMVKESGRRGLTFAGWGWLFCGRWLCFRCRWWRLVGHKSSTFLYYILFSLVYQLFGTIRVEVVFEGGL